MSSLESQIKTAFENLPDNYKSVLSKTDITTKVSEISDEVNLGKKETDVLDKEVTLLLLNISSTPDFITRLENKLRLEEDETLQITKAVTKRIIEPIEKQVSNKNGQNGDVSVPKPPSASDKPPTPNYGGGSDPYREPAE